MPTTRERPYTIRATGQAEAATDTDALVSEIVGTAIGVNNHQETRWRDGGDPYVVAPMMANALRKRVQDELSRSARRADDAWAALAILRERHDRAMILLEIALGSISAGSHRLLTNAILALLEEAGETRLVMDVRAALRNVLSPDATDLVLPVAVKTAVLGPTPEGS